MRTSTRVRKRTRLLGGRRAGVNLNWHKLGPDGWRQFVPWPSSLSFHVLGETWNPQRRTIYSNLPGPVDTVTSYGERAKGRKTPDYTPGGRSTRPGPVSPLGRLVRRLVGWLVVVALAVVYADVLGASSWWDVLTGSF
jgi:hypothetical protein